MKNDYIDKTLILIHNSVNVNSIMAVRSKLECANDHAFDNILSTKLYNPLLIALMTFFFGWLGVDRFLTKQIPLGCLRIFLFIGAIVSSLFIPILGIILILGGWVWIIIDLCTSYIRVYALNLVNINKAIEMAGIATDNSRNNNLGSQNNSVNYSTSNNSSSVNYEPYDFDETNNNNF